MKVAFTQPELAWLNDKTNKLMRVCAGTNNVPLQRVAAKMRYKFTPNASVCYLTQKESAALFALVEARVVELEPQGPEALMMKEIVRKLTAGIA